MKTGNLSENNGFNVTQTGGMDNANKTQDSGGGLQMMGLATGAVLLTQCNPPHRMTPCYLAGLAFADGLASGGSSDNAGYTAGAFNSGNPYTFKSANPTVQKTQDQIQAGIDKLKGAGVTVNADGSITTPTGARLTASDLDSIEDLMKQGLTEGQAKETMKQAKAAQIQGAQQAGVKLPAGFDSDDFGKESDGLGAALTGSQSNNGGSFEESSASGDGLLGESVGSLQGHGSKKRNSNRIPASQAAKLKKNFNGTPIGIGMADIFMIVNQKYIEKKEKKNEFLEREF